jgi:hypothetical protein
VEQPAERIANRRPGWLAWLVVFLACAPVFRLYSGCIEAVCASARLYSGCIEAVLK